MQQEAQNHFVVVRGNFSTAGNFSAYTLDGQRIHCPSAVMASAGLSSDEPVQFPLQILATKTTHNSRVVDGKVVPSEPWERLTAAVVCKSEIELAKLLAASQVSKARVAGLVAEAVKDIKVSEADLKQMQAAI